jgi:hypothetical protein
MIEETGFGFYQGYLLENINGIKDTVSFGGTLMCNIMCRCLLYETWQVKVFSH